jgi:hypothetical protein
MLATPKAARQDLLGRTRASANEARVETSRPFSPLA